MITESGISTALIFVLFWKAFAPITETDFPLPPGVKVYNPVAAQGGRKKENLQEMLKRMEDMLFVQNRMASEADYQNIILENQYLN